jgi:4-alpha-glucanotransferase
LKRRLVESARRRFVDPIFIDVAAVPEFVAIGGEASLSHDDGTRLDRARRSPSIDYGTVRQLKRQALRSAFERSGSTWSIVVRLAPARADW